MHPDLNFFCSLNQIRNEPGLESLRKRFNTYEQSTKGIIEHYRKLGKVREVDSTVSKSEVAEAVSKIIAQEFHACNDSGDAN